MPIKLIVLAAFCFAALPTWADDHPNSLHFDSDIADTLLYELVGRALDAFHDHLDLEGSVESDDQAQERRGHLTFKLYPKGKSRSDQHIAGETTFRFSTDPAHPSLHFEFKSSKDSTSQPSRLPDDAI
jgi:hypothetical protein